MKYNDFIIINESNDVDGYKKEIDVVEAVKLIKKHCGDIDIEKPLFRGMRKVKDAYVMEGQKGARVSRDTTNHYTLIIDDILKNQYSHAPLRSKSLICTNTLSYAKNYGTGVYAIFPYNDVEIGKCEYHDIWSSRITFDREVNGTLVDMNEFLSEIIYRPKSYDDIVVAFTKVLEDDSNEGKKDAKGKFYEIFKGAWEDWGHDEEWVDVDKADVVRGVFELHYDPEHALGMKFGTYKELEIDELVDEEHEFWFGGKCVAIEYEVYKKLLKDGEFE